jgi:hypothetical protein
VYADEALDHARLRGLTARDKRSQARPGMSLGRAYCYPAVTYRTGPGDANEDRPSPSGLPVVSSLPGTDTAERGARCPGPARRACRNRRTSGDRTCHNRPFGTSDASCVRGPPVLHGRIEVVLGYLNGRHFTSMSRVSLGRRKGFAPAHESFLAVVARTQREDRS